MEYFYVVDTAKEASFIIYPMITEQLKIWVTKYNIPNMNVKLLIDFHYEDNMIRDNLKIIQYTHFHLMKDNTINKKTAIFTLTLAKYLEMNDVYCVSIKYYNCDEEIRVCFEHIEDESDDIVMRMGIYDPNNKVIEKSDSSMDCQKIYDIIDKIFDQMMNHNIENYSKENEENENG